MSGAAAPLFTVLLPVNRGPELLRFAIASVQAQRLGDFELFVIGDGAPPATIALAEAAAAGDARLRVRSHPKAGLRGEIWRHAALREARGRFVCQLGDDDIWLPNHLEEMGKLLREADFGNTIHVTTHPDGRPEPVVGDLADPAVRRRMLEERYNVAGPTCSGYRLEAYRALSEGWSQAPADLWSDLFMWRKFLRQPGLRFATRFAVTAICLPNSLRRGFSIEQRAEESRRFAGYAADPAWRASYAAAALAQAGEGLLRLQAAGREAAARQASALAVELESVRKALRQAQRRANRAEARAAFVERSRFWRWRQRLARLLGRA